MTPSFGKPLLRCCFSSTLVVSWCECLATHDWSSSAGQSVEHSDVPRHRYSDPSGASRRIWGTTRLRTISITKRQHTYLLKMMTSACHAINQYNTLYVLFFFIPMIQIRSIFKSRQCIQTTVITFCENERFYTVDLIDFALSTFDCVALQTSF